MNAPPAFESFLLFEGEKKSKMNMASHTETDSSTAMNTEKAATSKMPNESVSDESEPPQPLAKKGRPRVSGRNLGKLLNSTMKISIREALMKNKINQVKRIKTAENSTESFKTEVSLISNECAGVSGTIPINTEIVQNKINIGTCTTNNSDKMNKDSVQMELENFHTTIDQVIEDKMNFNIGETMLTSSRKSISNTGKCSNFCYNSEYELTTCDIALRCDISMKDKEFQIPQGISDVENYFCNEITNSEMTPRDLVSHAEILANCDNEITKLVPQLMNETASTSQILHDPNLISIVLDETNKYIESTIESTNSEAESVTLLDAVGNTERPSLSLNRFFQTLPTTNQCIKRKFTEDIGNIESGVSSINSTLISKKTVKADLLTSEKHDGIEITLNADARKGSITKTESVSSIKNMPVNICTCRDVLEAHDSQSHVYCQAVDSYEEKLVGCGNPVITFRLVHASVQKPFTLMCDMHLWRLQQHHCCPCCGIFCSQGTFVQCKADKSEVKMLHLQHQKCQSKEQKQNYCLHCGSTSELEIVHLDCDLLSPPAFFRYQHGLVMPPNARISFSKTEISKTNECSRVDANNIYKMNDLSKVKDLLDLKAALEQSDKDFSTLPVCPSSDLYTASCNGDLLKVLQMLAKGVNPSEKFANFNGSTALHVASASGHVLIVHVLLQNGAAVDSVDSKMQTPLMLATERNQEKVVEYLVSRKVPLNTKCQVGMTCLHVAARDGHLNLCRLFMKSGNVLVNAQDSGGWTPIVWASEHGHVDIVKFLINKGGDSSIRDKEGNTALHWAAFCGTYEVCVALINSGCNVNETNDHGDTPLHIAARQDNHDCIDVFLSRSANLNIENKAGENPLDCCKSDPHSKSFQTIQVSMMLKSVFAKHHHKSEKIISNDITLGRERYPIRCINGIDDVKLDLKEFLYVTENCETCPIKIDRCITSLQHCVCPGDCTLPSCTCSAISLKCWYDSDGHLVPEFNMLSPPLLFECNRACFCDAGVCRNRVVQKGTMCRLELIRTEGKGWGVRTLKAIPKGTFICEYVGELITDSEADTREDDTYLFDLDNKEGETYCLDARQFGNISRFLNHLCDPNLIPVKVFVNHQDLNFPRIAFFSVRDIAQYEELGFDYGVKFWIIKSKSFTCTCGSQECMYSKHTIKETLKNY